MIKINKAVTEIRACNSYVSAWHICTGQYMASVVSAVGGHALRCGVHVSEHLQVCEYLCLIMHAGGGRGRLCPVCL